MDKKEIEQLANLARIRVSEEELAVLARDLGSIVAYVSTLNDVSLEGGATTAGGGEVNVFRDDEGPHEPGMFTDALINTAPQKEKGYISVEKVLKTDEAN